MSGLPPRRSTRSDRRRSGSCYSASKRPRSRERHSQHFERPRATAPTSAKEREDLTATLRTNERKAITAAAVMAVKRRACTHLPPGSQSSAAASRFAVGKDSCRAAASSPRHRAGLDFGIFAAREGLEANLLGLSLGVDPVRPALKLPAL